jgi:hypothetical protein
MLRIVWAVLLPACFLATSSSFAQGRSDIAEDLLRKCGLWEQLSSVEPQVQAGFAQAMSAAQPETSAVETERLARVIKSSYAPSRLRATASRVVAEGLAEQHAADLGRWYASPVGVAITKVEEQFSASQGEPHEVAAQGTAILEQSSGQRRELIDAIMRETKAVEAAVEMTLSVALAVQRGVAAATPSAPNITPADLRAALQAQRPRLLDAYSRLMAASCALTYKTVSDADLERYVAFIKSPAGQHFNALAIRALDAALSKATEELGRNLPSTKDRTNA